MTRATIDNPIINSPFIEPRQHWLTTDAGEVTGEIVLRRSPSEFLFPVGRPKKASGQLTMDPFGGPSASSQRDRQRDPLGGRALAHSGSQDQVRPIDELTA